jgi:hypothetical protein
MEPIIQEFRGKFKGVKKRKNNAKPSVIRSIAILGLIMFIFFLLGFLTYKRS